MTRTSLPLPPPAPAASGLPFGLSHARAAFLLVALATLLHVAYAGALALTPQEAYYWQWSRHLDLSYFDHPPLASWTIRFFTALFGDSERSIRLAAAFHTSIFCLFLFLAGRRLFGPRVALLAVASMLVVPFLSIGQTIITPDGPMVAGWVAALYFTVRALDEERGAWLLAAGAAVGLSMLGKYTGALLAPQILAVLLLDARGRRLLATPWPWLALVLTAAIFSPVVIWNARHGWASIAYQSTRRGAEMTHLDPMLTARFVGLQSLAVSPILWVVLLVAAVASARRWRDPPWRICALFSVPLLVLLFAVSPLHWVKLNWGAPAYPAALLAAAALYAEDPPRRRGLAFASLGLAALASLYMHLVPVVPSLPFSARDETSSGWRELAVRVEAELARIPGQPFVVGCYYKAASELAFYLPGRPETYSGNVFGDPGLQYDYWPGAEKLLGREGIVVVDGRDGYCARRGEVCEPLERLEPLTVRRGRGVVTTFDLYRCRFPPSLLGLAR